MENLLLKDLLALDDMRRASKVILFIVAGIAGLFLGIMLVSVILMVVFIDSSTTLYVELAITSLMRLTLFGAVSVGFLSFVMFFNNQKTKTIKAINDAATHSKRMNFGVVDHTELLKQARNKRRNDFFEKYPEIAKLIKYEPASPTIDLNVEYLPRLY